MKTWNELIAEMEEELIIEYVPLGVFWSGDWSVPEDGLYAHTTGRDRLELLRQSTYDTGEVEQDKSLYDLAVDVLSDAGLTVDEYWIDPMLENFIVPYSFFVSQSHREALRKIAEACVGQVYCDREGIIRVEGPGIVKGLSFDGVDDYVEADRFSVINHTGTYTFEAWIFWKGDVSGILYQTIMINGAGGSDRNGINITTNKQIGFQSYDGSNYNGRIYSPFPENEWVHVAAVSNAGTKKIYIDGVEVGEEGNNYQYSPSDYFRLSLHGITTNDTGPFNGVISEVRIWNVARTQQQIQDNMNKELTGNEEGLIGYWKFNEGAGTIAYDSAGANHGTIHGATWTYGQYDMTFKIDAATVFGVTPDEYFRKDNPAKWSEVANYIEVETQPLKPEAMTEVYSSSESVPIAAGQEVVITAQYNYVPCIDATASLKNAPTGAQIVKEIYYAGSAEITVSSTASGTFELVINAKPLKVQNKELVVAQDAGSIGENGIMKYTFPGNPLVQTRQMAQMVADTILSFYKDPRRDIEMDWRGNPAIELGDVIAAPDRQRGGTVDKWGYFLVTRQELEYTGALRAKLAGRRVTE